MKWQAYYQPPDASKWTGRKEKEASRFHQIVRCLDLHELSQWQPLEKAKQVIAILGFSSDEGVKRNQGRTGAKAGPDKLREKLSKLPHHFSHNHFNVFDLGNIIGTEDLEASQAALGELIAALADHGVMTVVLGGGHETAWGHYLGLHQGVSDKLGIINFDAHLDMRPLLAEPAVGSSGTPFLQIAKHRKKAGLPFNYTCIGLQKTANTPSLLDEIDTWGVNAVFAEECFTAPQSIQNSVEQNIQACDKLYISICLDVFAAAFSPGVSAPSAQGCLPWQFIPALQVLAQSGKVIALDIVELAPNLDEGDKTALLGATLIAEFIYQLKWD